MCKEHEPSDQFVSSLNWQLVSEIRREDRFEQGVTPRSSRSGNLRVWAMGLACFAMGIVGTTATQSLRTSPRAEYVLAKAESEAEIARARVDSTRQTLEWLRSKAAQEYPLYFDQAQREREVLIAQERLEDALSELDLKRLELRESRVTLQRPATEIWTPLVDGEDLLTQRLQIELKDARRKLDRSLQGTLSPNDPEERDAGQLNQEVEFRIEDLNHSIRLREQFLAGEVTKEELVDLERLTEAKQTVERITGVIDVYREIYEEQRAGFDAGQISPLTLLKWELDLKHMEASLSLAQTEVAILSAGLQPAAE